MWRFVEYVTQILTLDHVLVEKEFKEKRSKLIIRVWNSNWTLELPNEAPRCQEMNFGPETQCLRAIESASQLLTLRLLFARAPPFCSSASQRSSALGCRTNGSLIREIFLYLFLALFYPLSNHNIFFWVLSIVHNFFGFHMTLRELELH